MRTCLKKFLLAFSFLSSRGSGEGLEIGNILRRDEWVLCDGLCEPRSEHTWAVYTVKLRTADLSGCLVSVPWTFFAPVPSSVCFSSLQEPEPSTKEALGAPE